MFDSATYQDMTQNLLTSKMIYPRGMIIEFAKADDNATRELLRMLFDESPDLSERVSAFKVKAWQREYNCKAQDGLDFDVEKKAFVDASGNVAIDCSQYTFTAEIYGKFDASNSHYIPAFHDGYAVLAVLNDDKSPFFFVIDKKGNKQFEPNRFPDNFSTFEESMSFYISEDVMTYGSYTIGARFWYTEGWGSGENGEAKYLDHTGKEIEKLNDMNINFLAPFSDGVAAVSVFTNSDRNLSEYRYIDHDGNDLFPKH